MKDITIDGKSNFGGGAFGTIIIDGLAQCDGALEAEALRVDGKFKCLGDAKLGLLDCDGSAEFLSSVKAKKVTIDGLMAVTTPAKLEADEVHCDGSISIEGQISADVISIDGLVRAKELVGDRIYIHSHLGKFASLFFKGSTAELIEATTVELQGIRAQSVNGQDIVIGPECVIDTVDCSGTLSIDPRSTVTNLSGSYTLL